MNWGDFDAVERADVERSDRLFAPYDPLTGVGSPVERFRLYATGQTYILLPRAMDSLPLVAQIIKAGSIEAFARTTGVSSSEAEAAVAQLRIEHDFEFWAATCAKVQDKQTKRMVPFVLRPAQRKLLVSLMRGVEEQRPIRIVLLKARQWGGSTLVQLFMAWIQLFHRRAWHSVIVADVEDQARNIRQMYTRLGKEHPHDVFPIKFKPFEGSTKNREVVGRDCVIYLSSMQKPDSIRSADVMMAHLSEVGLWKETLGKKPEDVTQSIAGTIPSNEPLSIVVVESTAKGIGNFFHRLWTEATRDPSAGYEPVFVAWWEIEIYRQPFASKQAKRAFIASMTDKERYYFELGATLEGIAWYRHKKELDNLDDWRMACEYPTTPQEAFQSTGRRAHAPQYVEALRKFCRPPEWVGDLFADASYGPQAIGPSLHFAVATGGDLWLWAEPETGWKNRYVVSVDIGGRTEGADFSVISVIDRYWLSDGGVEECIGTWRGHLDQDLVIWKAVQIARYFGNALLVVERNSLDAKGSEGDHSLTILDEIKDHYDHLYYRSDPQMLREGLPARYGFHTNAATKTDLVTKMNRRLREGSYIERDARALDEADWYEIKPDGTYGAVDGQHDDIYMSRGIGLVVSEGLPIPSEVATKKVRTDSPKPVRTAANI